MASLGWALLICLLVGNVVCIVAELSALRQIRDPDLVRIEAQDFDQERQGNTVIGLILPDQINSYQGADPQFRERIQAAFGTQGQEIEIDLASLAHLVEEDPQRLSQLIIGSLERSWTTFWLVPTFTSLPADEVATQLGLSRSYGKGAAQWDEATWKYMLTTSVIQRFRRSLNDGLGPEHPRRILQALSGPIQWVTFISAVWCLLLLLALRKPWAAYQYHLVRHGQKPGEPSSRSFWTLDTDGKTYLDVLHADNEGLYLAPRLVQEYLDVAPLKDTSVYQWIRDRVTAYQDSVDIGEYEVINFLVWAVPSFGFIGTIFGIIKAMENASSIVSASTAVEQGIALDKIAGSLGTAFDTSLVALVWVVMMSFALARTRKAEANLFQELEQQAIKQLGTPQTR